MTTREKANQIFNSAVAAVQPAQLIPAHLFIKNNVLHIFDRQFLIKELKNIYVIGAGKASAAMAKTVEEILGSLITEGKIVTKYEHSIPLQKIICLEAAHPVPDENGIAATIQTVQLLQRAGENDLVICLLSGGASSLWIDIPEGASLNDLQFTYELLLKSGVTIEEMNTIRKHLSAIKGGQILQYAPNTNWFSLIISDVPGDDISIIASGPTVADITTFDDVKTILNMYNLFNQLPATICQHINAGIKAMIKDTPKSDDPVFKKVYNKIIGNNAVALKAATDYAKQLNYAVVVADNTLHGDAAKVGRELVQQCKKYTGTLPACWLLGGETTVKVKGEGKGGRNQQMALSALLELSLDEYNGMAHTITFLSAGTDGTDGPTDAAGAIVDDQNISLAKENNLDAAIYLANNDAYHFFLQTGSLIKTGATQTNVMDVVVVIIE